MNEQLKELERQYNETKLSITTATTELMKLGQEIEKLKKEEAKAVGLKKPIPSSRMPYYAQAGNGDSTVQLSAIEAHSKYYRGFISTNKAQVQAFRDAIDVMAELRTQPGIVVPDGQRMAYTLGYNLRTGALDAPIFCCADFQLLSPAFDTVTQAKAAIIAVGIDRIKAAVKTLLFMTPESRGEV
jgi:hypothetical protein